MKTQKFRNDFSKCNGDKCIHKYRCIRYFAHLEAVELKLERCVYTDPKECIDKYYFMLTIEETR